MKQIGSIKKLERNLEGHSYTEFEVGKEISEILDCSIQSEDGRIYSLFEIRYRSGIVKELHGGLFTVTRNAVAS